MIVIIVIVFKLANNMLTHSLQVRVISITCLRWLKITREPVVHWLQCWCCPGVPLRTVHLFPSTVAALWLHVKPPQSVQQEVSQRHAGCCCCCCRDSRRGGLQATLHKQDAADYKPGSRSPRLGRTAVKVRDVLSQRHLQPSEHPGAQKEDEEETLRAAESEGFPSQWPRAERPDVGGQSLGRYVRCFMALSLSLSLLACVRMPSLTVRSLIMRRLMTWARCLYLWCCFQTTSNPAPRSKWTTTSSTSTVLPWRNLHAASCFLWFLLPACAYQKLQGPL